MFQVLGSSKAQEMKGLELSGDPNDYHYTSQGVKSAPTDSDRSNHRATVAACKTLGFNATEVDTLWRVVAAVLHLVIKCVLLEYYSKVKVKCVYHLL